MLFDDIKRLPGVGDKRLEALHKLGIRRRIDFIFHSPRRYEDRRLITAIKDLHKDWILSRNNPPPVLIMGEVLEIKSKSIRPNLSLHRARLCDGTGEIVVPFFNQDYILSRYKPGARWVVFGVYHGKGKTGAPGSGGRFRREPEFSMKEVDISGTGKSIGLGAILAFYPATAATPQSYLRRIVADLVYRLDRESIDAPRYEEMPGFSEAARMMHLPRTLEEGEAGRKRLALDELVTVRFCVQRVRRSRPPIARPPRQSKIVLELPFRLTAEQEAILRRIKADLDGQRSMRRLVEGDVGSGKTVLAILGACRVAERGLKTAYIAPTEILAEQHHLVWSERLEAAGLPSHLLTGSTKKKERAAIYEAAGGAVPGVFFGTHALLSETLAFVNLGLVVIDEQQRFGVNQREAILRKGAIGAAGIAIGATPDLLIMTATPIPRTLAMTQYGDLDVSTLAHRLPGRTGVPTIHLVESERRRLMPHLKNALARGERVYIVYPIIDEDEELDLRDAKGQHKKIAAAFPEVGTALLTGATRSAKKESTMRDFRDGRISILVSTSVVEVGLDVPEATLMIVEHAEYFGLAQLHQLRGRVGRSSRGGTCVLVTGDELGDYARSRIDALVACQDGFKIAEEDLVLRGTGEIMGERQHGGDELRLARLGVDSDLISRAKEVATNLLDTDPLLSAHAFLRGLAESFEQSGADSL